MRRYALLAIVALACRSRSTGAPASAAPPDAGPPTERPALATPALVGALLAGAQPWSRVLGPRDGVFELRNIDGDRHTVSATSGWRCGAERDRALAQLMTASAPHPGDDRLGYKFGCINDGLDDPRPTASCAIYADAASAPGFSLVFVPAPTLGLRLAGVMMGDEGAIPADLLRDFDAQVARADARCP